MRRKPWWHSKTIWANALVAGLGVLELKTGALQPLLPVNFYSLLSVGLPVLNIMLRTVSTQGIAARGNGRT